MPITGKPIKYKQQKNLSNAHEGKQRNVHDIGMESNEVLITKKSKSKLFLNPNQETKIHHPVPFSTFSTTFKAFLAEKPPIDTWSSWPADVLSESTDEGWQRTLFSDTVGKKDAEK